MTIPAILEDVLHLSSTPTPRDLLRDLGADSLDRIEIIVRIEDEFDMEFTDAQAENCRSVQDLMDLVA